ncbi:MAG: trigger factor [Roseovarius sp.]|nr:trigger factor [Roseovarius sp.]MCY4290667.1 trigger factor [Roseovarius sp.]MCY4317155.1 trigger factor [Roseovarius sp.]
MQITETVNEGLKRECKIVLPAESIDGEMIAKLAEMQPKLIMKGFRKGKIPIPMLQKMHGVKVREEVITNTLNAAIDTHFKESEDVPIMRPSVNLINADQKIGDDLEFNLEYEVFPECPEVNLDELDLEKMVAKITEDDVEEKLSYMLATVVKYTARDKGSAVEVGDKVIYDLVTHVDGRVDEGQSGKREIILESADKPKNANELIGLTVGDKKNIKLPAEAGMRESGDNPKEIELSLKIKEIECPIAYDNLEELAKRFDFDSVDELKENVYDSMVEEYGYRSDSIIEMEIFQYLEKYLAFELPQKLVEIETEVQRDNYYQSSSNEEEISDETSRKHEKEAKRRVGLALLLSDIGKRQNLKLENEEIEEEIEARLSAFGANKEIYYSYLKSTPAEMENIRAMVFERKVLNYIAKKRSASEKEVPIREIDEKMEKLNMSDQN